jgi:hypothetical protein
MRACSVVVAIHLLWRSTDNEAEAFAMVRDGLDRRVDLLRREEVLIDMGTSIESYTYGTNPSRLFISSVTLQLAR